jgi:NitT/TauT family transport system substrate-binding protein
VELVKPFDTPLGEPVRALVMTEKLYGNHGVALRTMKCFVDATNEFIDKPQEAEKSLDVK